jgi:hypothetical protein
MTPFKIPKTIEDVTPELCRRVFTEICGGEIKGSPSQFGTAWIFPNGISKIDYFFNPFVDIRDTKLCDSWIFKNELVLDITLYPYKTQYVHRIGYPMAVLTWKFTTIEQDEAFGRMCVILKAYNKLQEAK